MADGGGEGELRDAIESFGCDLYGQLVDQLRLLISLITLLLLLALLLTLVRCFVIWRFILVLRGFGASRRGVGVDLLPLASD